MEQSPNISRKFHLRMMSLLGLLWIVDCGLLLFAVESILVEGPTVMIMFASEVSSDGSSLCLSPALITWPVAVFDPAGYGLVNDDAIRGQLD